MIVFQVNDMTCGHCAATITKALKGADPEAQVRIELAGHLVMVEPAASDAASLRAAIEDAGYTAVAQES